MRGADWKTNVLPSLLSGTDRLPLKLEERLQPSDALAALSLTGQALRFTNPTRPVRFDEVVRVIDERRILPEEIRKPLIWLFKGSRLIEDAELALAWKFARLKLRPHPFDMPRMATFVKAHAEELGTTAVHWARGEETVQEPMLGEDEAIDDVNWQTARPAMRARFVAEQRRQDPARALDLVRAVWGRDDAEMRFRLLESLQTALDGRDREFLAGLEKDRSTRVRALAQRMLYRLDGYTGEHPALRECLSRITKKTEGLLRKRIVLSLEVPATIKEHTLKGWIRETFAEVGIDELGRGLGISENELVEASAKDANLLLALVMMATVDLWPDILGEAVKRLPEAWEQMAQSGPVSLERMSPEDRMRWAGSLAGAYGGEPPFSFAAWSWMHRALRGPLPAESVDAVMQSKTWQERLQEAKGPDWAELLAACCPEELRRKMRGLLSAIEPAQAASALALLDILEAMERV